MRYGETHRYAVERQQQRFHIAIGQQQHGYGYDKSNAKHKPPMHGNKIFHFAILAKIISSCKIEQMDVYGFADVKQTDVAGRQRCHMRQQQDKQDDKRMHFQAHYPQGYMPLPPPCRT